jgi:hypothetical protein
MLNCFYANAGQGNNRFISNRKRPFDRLRVTGHGELVEPSRRLTKTFALINNTAAFIVGRCFKIVAP